MSRSFSSSVFALTLLLGLVGCGQSPHERLQGEWGLAIPAESQQQLDLMSRALDLPLEAGDTAANDATYDKAFGGLQLDAKTEKALMGIMMARKLALETDDPALKAKMEDRIAQIRAQIDQPHAVTMTVTDDQLTLSPRGGSPVVASYAVTSEAADELVVHTVRDNGGAIEEDDNTITFVDDDTMTMLEAGDPPEKALRFVRL